MLQSPAKRLRLNAECSRAKKPSKPLLPQCCRIKSHFSTGGSKSDPDSTRSSDKKAFSIQLLTDVGREERCSAGEHVTIEALYALTGDKWCKDDNVTRIPFQ